ncbi:MAG: hypothetical protein ACRCS9_13865 [Hyphomicrobium sp.]
MSVLRDTIGKHASGTHMMFAALVLRRAVRIVPDGQGRNLARYLAHTEGGVAIKSLARVSGGISRTEIKKQIRWIEDLRDDAAFDGAVAALGSAFVHH